MNQWQLKNRIIRRLHKIRDELQQVVNDKEWWNENRKDAEPFDVGWDRVMLRNASDQIEAWESGDIEKANSLNAKMQEIAATATDPTEPSLETEPK